MYSMFFWADVLMHDALHLDYPKCMKKTYSAGNG